MSNLHENENMKETIQSTEADTATKTDSDTSTIFSDPSVHKKQSPVKQKKARLPVIISSILAVAILVGGTVAVVKLIPEKEDETASSSDLDSIEVLKMSGSDFKTVTVTNSKGTYKMYSETTQSESSSNSSSTSSSSTVTSWYLDGYDKSVVSSTAISNIVSQAASINAIREIDKKNAEQCGLDNPVSKVDVVTNDNAEFSVLVGADSPDNTGVYLKLSTSDVIYLVDSSIKTDFDFDVLSLANTEAIPGITLTSDMDSYKGDDGTLTKFDSLTVTGKNFPEAVLITPNTDANLSQYAAFMTVTPTKRIADKVDSLFTLFKSGVSVTGAYSFDASAASVSKLGLNAPDFAATMKIGSHTFSYKFKLQEDGNYAVLCNDSNMIKMVASSSLEFIDYHTNDFYASWVCLVTISDLSNFSLKTTDKTYSFDINYDSEKDSDEAYDIQYNGTKLDAENFKTFYQYCIALKCADYTVDKLSGNPDLTLTFTYSDTNRTPSVVEFKKASETKYQYKVDGIDMGKITSADFNKIAKYAEKIANGDKIN